MVTQKKSVIVNEMSEEEVGKKIAAHCAGYKIIKTVSFDKGSINDAVKEIIKGLYERPLFSLNINLIY